ncbi:hypothetical protein C8R45DRAFT_1107444 [Mycena sanguinolenta]|nr:hypothetical protein C8R45DRAFT_1107444 [Mycena sanguinolenta]
MFGVCAPICPSWFFLHHHLATQHVHTTAFSVRGARARAPPRAPYRRIRPSACRTGRTTPASGRCSTLPSSVFVGLVALTVVRLHFLLAVGTHYNALVRFPGAPSASSSAASSSAAGYAPIYVVPSPSPETLACARAYVRAQPRTEAEEDDVPLDVGLLDARVVRTKRGWI